MLANENISKLFKEWEAYLSEIPVCGAILINPSMTKCLMIRGVNTSKWGFPKGKINRDEDELECAIREVAEEVGFDVSPYIDRRAFFETHERRFMRLYVARDVPESIKFKANTRNEIQEIVWFSIKKLKSKKNMLVRDVQNILDSLVEWVEEQKADLNPLKGFSFKLHI